jgi:hypothetical protein
VCGVNNLLKLGKQKSSGRPLTAEDDVGTVFSFPVAVNNSIKVGPLVFLLSMFVITENIMKRHV